MKKLINLNPERVFYYFEEISNIPRESGNEKAISNFLVETAKKLNLEYYQDKLMNVIIKKPASKGYENSAGIILQGHMDMVCEKESFSSHNFKNDPLELIVEGNTLRANNTTLGADNGIALAMSLAILEDKNLEHPELEFLATIEEETTMAGALGLEENILKGKYLINIDSEEEALLTAGSAGGKGIKIYLKDEKIKIDKNNFKFLRIKVSGLLGGHSGIEIDKERANSIKVFTKLLNKIREKINFQLCFIDGGSKDNAIPRECYADIAIKNEDYSNFLSEINLILNSVKEEFFNLEKNINLEFSECSSYETIFSEKISNNLLNILDLLPSGPHTWMKEYPIVESSTNLAIIKTLDEKILINISLRSSNSKILKELTDNIVNIAEKNEATCDVSNGYPAWPFKENSSLRDIAVKTYKNLFDEEMRVTVLHAGLECGAIASHYKDLDMISIGPNIYNVHTPKEYLEIKSVEKYFYYLKELLKNLK